MGIFKCGELLWKATNLNLKDIHNLVKFQHPNINDEPPRLDIDVFNVVRTRYRNKDKSYGDVLYDFAELCKVYSEKGGFYVTLVLDGKKRHHSKRVSLDRKSKKEFDKIDAFHCRQQAMIIGSKADARVATLEEIESINEYNMEAKLLEKRINNVYDLPETFKDDLYRRLLSCGAFNKNPDNDGLVNDNIIESEFQADPILAYRAMNRLSHCIHSTDSDYNSLLGSKSVLITEINVKDMYKKTETSFENFTVSGVCNEYMKLLQETVLTDNNFIEWKPAEKPLLASDNFLVRALVSVVLGNDYILGNGIRGIGVVNMERLLEKMKKEVGIFTAQNRMTDQLYIQELEYVNLRKYICEESNVDHNDLITLVLAQIAEPYIIEENEKKKYLYIYGIPPFLPEYLKEYKSSDENCTTQINPGPSICQCCGINGESHPFLQAEGKHSCSVCNATFCCSCGYIPSPVEKRKIYHKNRDHKMCHECYRNATLSFCGREDATNTLTTAEMLRQMKDINGAVQVTGNNPLSPGQIEELYDAMIALQSANPHTRSSKEIPFPLQSPSFLDNMEVICKHDLIKGASFVADAENLSPTNILSILQTFSSLVTFSSKRYTQFDSHIYKALPEMFVEFANGARVDSGYRLLSRAIRHATDPKSRQIVNTRMMLSKTNTNNNSLENNNNSSEQCCIVLENKVPASMKQVEYDVKVAFTHSEIVSCSCNCRAGGESKMKDRGVVCVHTLPLLYQLHILLIEGLAQHFLIELANIWDDRFDNIVKNKEKKIKNEIRSLMRCDGMGEDDITKSFLNKSILEVLKSFSVGTEKHKINTLASPRKHQLIPLRKYDHRSSTMITLDHKKQINEEKEQLNKQTSSSSNKRKADTTETNSKKKKSKSSELEEFFHTALMKDVPKLDVDYYNLYVGIYALNPDLLERTNIIGLKLITHRSKPLRDSLSLKEFQEDVKICETNWKDAFEIAQKRKRNIDTSYRYKSKDPPNESSNATTTTVDTTNTTDVSNESSKVVSTSNRQESGLGQLPLSSSSSASQKNNKSSKSLPIKKKRKTKSWSKKCCFNKCNNTNLDVTRKGITFDTISPLPPELPDDASKKRVISYEQRRLRRLSVVRLCTIEKDENKKLHLCCEHPYQKTKSYKTIKIKGKDVKVMVESYLPTGEGVAITRAETVSGGIASDRLVADIIEKLNDEGMTETLWKELMLVHDSISEDKRIITQRIIDKFPGFRDKYDPNKMRKKSTCRISTASSPQQGSWDATPVVLPRTPGKDKEIKSRTGFLSEDLMLAFMFILANGNFIGMTETFTNLTWYEEYYFFFEKIYGRTLVRNEDADRQYRCSKSNNLFKSFLKLCLAIRNSWPTYVSHEEDVLFRKDHWNVKYRNKRVVFWDNTDVPFGFKPSSAENQRITYSKYYNGNCAKGGVFIQLCGWLGVSSLWVGNISDSEYMKRTGIFREQDLHAEKDKVGGIKLAFINIFDKGYRLVFHAWQYGKQLLFQPVFARADEKFTANEVTESSSVASDRSGNERAVGVCCRSSYISRGFVSGRDPEVLDDAWMSWSFMSNFMYEPVL